MKKKKVVVALSGGKDSTASILLLREQNYEVAALTMKMGIEGEDVRLEKIENLVKVLDVPFRVVDLSQTFKEKVIDYFIRTYTINLTPNPCVQCNNEIKFNLLMQEALKQEEADFYATGHYASKIEINGKYFLKEPLDTNKSQIYFLSMIGNQALENVLFPISSLTIQQVREKVRGLPLANIQESQDVCFLQDKKLIDFLKKHLPQTYFKPGDFLDIHGNKIGTHQGSVYFTIGQRRGTGFASDRKLYVVNKNIVENTVTLGDEKDLYSDTLHIIQPVYWKEIKPGERYKTKVRYQTTFSEVEITEATQERLAARFLNPVKSVTPGQIGAFYQDDVIVAGGYIQ